MKLTSGSSITNKLKTPADNKIEELNSNTTIISAEHRKFLRT